MKKILSVFVIFAALLSMQLFYDGQRELKTLAVEMGDGQDIQCCTCGDSFYYLVYDEDPIYYKMRGAVLYEQKADGKPRELFRIDSGSLFWINELTATEGFVFWVYSDGNRTAIECIDIDSKECRVIADLPLGSSLLLDSNDRYVTWPVSNDNIGLHLLDTCDMSLTKIEDHYTLAGRDIPSEDDLLAYIGGISGERQIIVYDIKTRERRFFDIAQWPLFNLEANSDWVIFTDKRTGDRTIFALNLHNDQVQSYPTEYYGFRPLAFHLYKDNIVVNSNSTGEVVIINLLHGSLKRIYAGGRLATTSVNEDGLFCGVDKETKCLRYLHLD